MIILPQKSLHRLLLALLVLHPLSIFPQQSLKVFSSLLPVDGIAHLLCYLRREIIPDESLLRLIRFVLTADFRLRRAGKASPQEYP